MIATWASAILLQKQEVLRENCFYVMSCIIHDQVFYCLIPEYLQPDGVSLWYFKLCLFCTEKNPSL